MRLLLVGVLIVLNGCYAYQPTAGELPARQSVVRTRLGEPTSFTIENVSLHAIDIVEGEVVRWDDEMLVLSAKWLASTAGQEFPGHLQTVFVPRDRITMVEQRQVAKLRTAGFVGLAILVSALVRTALPGGGSSGDLPPGGGSTK